ncbi:MAG: acetylxylan esterase [Verrucomicrobia bacterium]|nr:acetylxylan esterase [Verrucomicrobiota bacterium]
MTTRFGLLAACSLAALCLQTSLHADGPRVLPEGKVPNDVRLQPLKDLDGYFPFTPPTSKDAWAKRAERVRRQILVSQGLWPMPTKTPLNAVIHGKIDKGEYTVEKVYFESAPGFFVTGNLYKPAKLTGKAPAVLFAHGHWKDARLSEAGDAELLNEIATGQERFEQGGRSRFQSMCVQLARMGCIVWQWDMLSDSDSKQFSPELVHRFAKQRPEMNTTENWGLYSPQAESHLQSIMGLQTINAVRSLDFVLSLPEVDADRIAVTGASGGGTQTFILSGIDPRVKLSFPAVMVSTAMQGGCTCENACLLRVNTGNIEFAGLFAPKPQGMTTANDWTKEMATKGFPELKALYKFLGAPNNVMLHRAEHFPHNYNAVARSAFYTWVNKHFKLGFKEPVIERDYQPLPKEQLTVWNAEHPAPKESGEDFERKLLRWWHEDAQKQIADAAKSPERFREVVGGALEVVIGRTFAEAGEVQWEMLHKTDRGSWIEMSGLLRNKTYGEELPAVFAYPKNWKGTTTIWLSDEGKSGLFTAGGALKPEAQDLLKAGATVVGIDLLHQGEFLADGQKFAKTGRVKNPREAAPYTFGYNHAVLAQRVHDVLTAVKFTQAYERPSKRIQLLALDGAAPIAAAAAAMCGNAINDLAIDTQGFRFGKVLHLHDPNFLPGGAKYGDVPAMLQLAGDKAPWIRGEGSAQPPVNAVTQLVRRVE